MHRLNLENERKNHDTNKNRFLNVFSLIIGHSIGFMMFNWMLWKSNIDALADCKYFKCQITRWNTFILLYGGYIGLLELWENSSGDKCYEMNHNHSFAVEQTFSPFFKFEWVACGSFPQGGFVSFDRKAIFLLEIGLIRGNSSIRGKYTSLALRNSLLTQSAFKRCQQSSAIDSTYFEVL